MDEKDRVVVMSSVTTNTRSVINALVNVGATVQEAADMIKESCDLLLKMEETHVANSTADVRVRVTDQGRRVLNEAEKAARRARLEEALPVAGAEGEGGSVPPGLHGAAEQPGRRTPWTDEDTACYGIDPSPRHTGYSAALRPDVPSDGEGYGGW